MGADDSLENYIRLRAHDMARHSLFIISKYKIIISTIKHITKIK